MTPARPPTNCSGDFKKSLHGLEVLVRQCATGCLAKHTSHALNNAEELSFLHCFKETFLASAGSSQHFDCGFQSTNALLTLSFGALIFTILFVTDLRCLFLCFQILCDIFFQLNNLCRVGTQITF